VSTERGQSAQTQEGTRTAKRRARWAFGFGAALLGAAAALVASWLAPFGPERRAEAPALLAKPLEVPPEVTLYFGDARWTRLLPEMRAVALPAEQGARVRALVQELVRGPQEEGSPVLPPGAKLRQAYVGGGGLALIDFEASPGELGGASGELLSVFALVHTITRNVPGVQSLQILVNGQERETFAGHVKISEPLRPDARWLPAPGP
jgi:hypothetical protein